MNNPGLAQKMKVLFLCGIGLLFAIILGWNIGSENYILLLLGMAMVALLSIAIFSRRYYWIVTIASSFLAGMFPILGAKFTPFQVLIAVGVGKFLIEDVVLRRATLKSTNRFNLLMIAGFMSVLTWHGIHDRFGMRFLGSSVWGGHNYVNVYVGLVAYFVTQSIPINLATWAKLPLAVFAVISFDLLIAIITTISPGSIYIIFPFYSAVSSGGMEELITGSTTDISSRIGAFGTFGFVLILIVFSAVPLTQIFNPRNFFRLVCVGIGFVSTLLSGYRTSVVSVAVGLLTVGIRDLKYGVILLVALLGATLFGLSEINANVFQLPRQVQRGLAFFPGHWDVDTARDATASNDFRQRVWKLWGSDYFPEHPLIGRGFGFKSEWSKQSVYYGGAIDYERMVETGNLHNGLFATLDAVGITGAIFFIIWNLWILVQTFGVGFRKGQEVGNALRFLALYLAVSIFTFWFGAQDLGSFLPRQFALTGVFLALRGAMAPKSEEKHPVAPKSQDFPRQVVPA
jgi:hypothetical protein